MQQKEKKEEEKNLLKIKEPKLIITQQKSKKMTLKELQSMIKEEFDAYTNEAEDVDVSVSDNDIDAEMGDEMEDAGDEDMLRNMYDMLKAKFDGEGEEEAEDGADTDMDDMGEDMMGEVKDDETKDEAADYTEAASMGFGDKGNKKTSGAHVGYKTVGKLSEGVKRFQKLANIIK